ncbi:MAG: TetR/AcrR family transcriptional regulator [Mesorhizobium sp.]
MFIICTSVKAFPTLSAAREDAILSEATIGEQAQDGSRAHILAVAAQCFRERGYAATSIDDVARRLGATKGRIYHHFSSKGDLFAQVFRAGMDMNFEAIAPFENMGGRAIDVWRAAACAHVRSMIVTQAFQRVVWEGVELHMRGSTTPEERSKYNELIEYRARYDRIFRSLIVRARDDGDMKFDNASIAAQIMFTSMNSPIFWYSPRSDQSGDDIGQIVKQVVDFVQGGLGGKVERVDD